MAGNFNYFGTYPYIEKMNTQTGGNDNQKYQNKRRGFFLPLIFITLGTILLLNNLQIIPWETWETLMKLSPMLLILWGLKILLGN